MGQLLPAENHESSDPVIKYIIIFQKKWAACPYMRNAFLKGQTSLNKTHIHDKAEAWNFILC